MQTRSHSNKKEEEEDLEVRDMKHGYVPGDSSETLPGGREKGQREHFEEICRDENYEIEKHHISIDQ